MLITKRGEKQHDYRKFKCPICCAEMIADANSLDCRFRDGKIYTTCPVCGYILRYDKHGQGRVSTEEYNKIKSQYEQME